MIDALRLVAILAGCYAAWHGSRAAFVLLASAALTSALAVLQVPFGFGTWLLIDLAVIAAIECERVGKRERAIIALMVPVWPLYQIGTAEARDAIILLVSAQFLVTVPWDRLGQLTWTESRAW